MNSTELKKYGWNGREYIAGNVPDDLFRLLRHICTFWKDGVPGWAPTETNHSLYNINFRALLNLAEEIPVWYAGKSLSDGQLLLAWVTLGAIAESSLKWFLSIYAKDYYDDPLLRKNSDTIPPEDVFFAKAIDYLEKHIWIESQTDEACLMSRCLHTIRLRRNVIHCKKEDMGTWDEWREYVRTFLAVLCSLEGRVPYPEECFGYPLDAEEILEHYSLKALSQCQSQGVSKCQ